MEEGNYKVYSYRWVVLAVFMLVIFANQMMWITFASITSMAADFYAVSDLSIGLLSMSFMIVYIFVSIPASWTIDTYGFRVGVGIGAVLTGIFGLTRGLMAGDYTLVLISQIGIAIGQPFILNAFTPLPAKWFPIGERAMAAGMGTLAMYVGIIAGLVLTPFLVSSMGMQGMLIATGIIGLAAAVLFLVFAKAQPPTPACPPGMEARSLMFDGMKQMLQNRNFILLLVVFFIGLGVFNSVTTWIAEILSPRGFTSEQAGIAGGLMVVGGVFGALVLPMFSDRKKVRVPFLNLAVLGATIGLAGITFAMSYGVLLAASFMTGFFLLSAGPLGFQYGAEITYPAPEGTSNGLLLMMGQISGILFIFAMDAFKAPDTGSMTASLVVLIVLMIIGFVITTRLKESTLLSGSSSG